MAEFYNATATDGYNTHAWTSTTTTFSSGSITSTVNGDLWFELACTTNTLTNIGAFTVGSQTGITWYADLADRNDGCAIQHGIQTTAAALNPQMTNATAYDGVALGIAFKAGTQGTAPSGMYIVHLYTLNPTGTPLTSYQVPIATAGDLMAMPAAGNSPILSSNPSDPTNGTWKSCGPVNTAGYSTGTYYVPNASAGLLAVTLPGLTQYSGPLSFYDIAGAATTQLCGRAEPAQNSSTNGSTLPIITNYTPTSSAGVAFYTTAVTNNTFIGLTAPTGGQYDGAFYGGESLNGPDPVDQNQGPGHYYYSSNAEFNVTWTLTGGSNPPANSTTDVVSFQSPGATLYPVSAAGNGAGNQSGGLSTTIALASYAPYQSGDGLGVFTCALGISSGTITVSDPTNGTYTQVVAPTSVSNASGNWYCGLFSKFSISASTVTITATFSAGGSSTGMTIMAQECAECTAVDLSAITTVTTTTGGVFTGPSTGTLNVANEFIAAFFKCSGGCNLLTNETSMPSGFNSMPWSNNVTDRPNVNWTGISQYASVSATTSIAAGNGADSGGASGTAEVAAYLTFH